MMKCLTDPKNIKKKMDIRTMPVYGGDEFFDCISSELLRLLKDKGAGFEDLEQDQDPDRVDYWLACKSVGAELYTGLVEVCDLPEIEGNQLLSQALECITKYNNQDQMCFHSTSFKYRMKTRDGEDKDWCEKMDDWIRQMLRINQLVFAETD